MSLSCSGPSRTDESDMRFGAATSLCTDEIRRLAGSGATGYRMSDLTTAYLHMLDDFADFVLANSLDVAEIEPGFSVIGARELSTAGGELRRILSRFRSVSCHLPLGEINIAAFHAAVRQASLNETKRHIELCQELGVTGLVMHPGCFAATPDRYLMLAAQARAVAERSVLELRDFCAGMSMQLAVENMHSKEPFFQRPEEFERLVAAGVGMALDTVHAHVSGVDPLDFIAMYGRRIAEVHLTDGIAGEPLAHYPVGTGEVDCLAVLGKLREMDFDGSIILEVESKQALTASLEFLRAHGFS
jgi:sugar phosphate isomerase/epimerase